MFDIAVQPLVYHLFVLKTAINHFRMQKLKCPKSAKYSHFHILLKVAERLVLNSIPLASTSAERARAVHDAARKLAHFVRSCYSAFAYGSSIHFVTHTQLNMRIFKVKKSHKKSRRYVKQRIYGFSVFSKICTFVQRGVQIRYIRRILCLRKLKSSPRKSVRQVYFPEKP